MTYTSIVIIYHGYILIVYFMWCNFYLYVLSKRDASIQVSIYDISGTETLNTEAALSYDGSKKAMKQDSVILNENDCRESLQVQMATINWKIQ